MYMDEKITMMATPSLLRRPIKPELKAYLNGVKAMSGTGIKEWWDFPRYQVAGFHIDGKHKPGFIVCYESLEMALKKAKKSGMVMVGLKDLGVTGYIGSYARIAAENDLIFIGFNNSPGGLVPFGSVEAIWGTDPLTIGVPTDKSPAILDMASSMTTWGDLMVSKNEGKKIKTSQFGDSRYEDYTQHKDKKRRDKYRDRHKKDLASGDYMKPGFLSYYILWGASTDLDKNISSFKRRFKLK